MRAGDHGGFRGERSFDWDTSRRARQPGRAPAAPIDGVKVFLWTLGILIGVPVAILVLAALACVLGS